MKLVSIISRRILKAVNSTPKPDRDHRIIDFRRTYLILKMDTGTGLDLYYLIRGLFDMFQLSCDLPISVTKLFLYLIIFYNFSVNYKNERNLG